MFRDARRAKKIQNRLLLHKLGPGPPHTGPILAREHRCQPVHAHNLLIRQNQRRVAPIVIRMERRVDRVVHRNVPAGDQSEAAKS